MKKIIVITKQEVNEMTGEKEIVVSHGINIETGKVVTLPPVSPREVGARWDLEIGEFVIEKKGD